MWFMDIHIKHTLPFVCSYMYMFYLMYACPLFTYIFHRLVYIHRTITVQSNAMDFEKYDQNDMTIKGSIKDRETVYMHMDMIRAGSLTQ